MVLGNRNNGHHHPIEGQWWWVGLHGGAGVTTLAAAAPGGVDAGTAVPEVGRGPRLPVVCVVRSHASGLTRAQEQAPWWREHAADYDVVGLVVVADAPGLLPKPIDQLLRLTAGGWPKVWRLPWVHAWRVGWAPSAETTPAAYVELGHELRQRFGTAPLVRSAPGPTLARRASSTVPERLPIGGDRGGVLRRVGRPGRK